MSRSQYIILLRIICSAVLFISGILFEIFLPIDAILILIIYILAAIIVGFDVLIDAFNGIFHGHVLDENFLMTAGSVCAFILGEFAEGTVILLLYQVGELFQSVAVGKSRNSITELMNICPDEARLENGEIVDPFSVNIGDIIIVNPGEKIALDGIILKGSSNIDTSSLTGEHIPRSADVGDTVLSGCINLSSPIQIKVTKEFSESTVSKILELAENASTRKAKIEGFVTRFAKIYTPAVVIAAILIATIPPLFFSLNLSDWLLRAVMFIVISCPCALVVSVPLTFFGALGGASKAGILIKGSNYLEALGKTDTIIFDKTGTLTTGTFSVTKICVDADISEADILDIAALCEYHSDHPIALSIKEACENPPTPSDDMNYENISGKGVVVRQDSRLILAGNSELIKMYGYNPLPVADDATAVHIFDRKYLGYILLEDTLKPSSKMAISTLKKSGVKQTVILSGDSYGAVKKISKQLSVDSFYSELLPSDKVTITEKIISSSKGMVAFVGDGVNDAPVISRADVGIAMGALGSDAAIEAADIVIMNDDLTLISKAISISRKAMKICKQNIFFSLLIKFSQLILSLVGLSNIWMAVFADVGVLILAILNSMRTLYTKKS